MSRVTLNKAVLAASAQHPKPQDFRPSYGTAGFRTAASALDSTLFRCGILAGLRAQQCASAVGLMVTASHNPEPDNGVKMVESNGEMLVPDWEKHATAVANASTDQELLDALQHVIQIETITASEHATVLIGGDTRPHTVALVQAACEGVELSGARVVNIGTCTTPVLHYSVLRHNDPRQAPYGARLVEAFKSLTSECKEPELSICLDCARGVGAIPPDGFAAQTSSSQSAPAPPQTLRVPTHGLAISLFNTPPPPTNPPTPTGLNDGCGSDFVQTQMQWPQGLSATDAAHAACCASFDGDADRIIFYSPAPAAEQRPRILDGDYIAALVATFAQQLLHALPTTEELSLGVVQTAYANGGATAALAERGVAVELALTGVKHLHRAAHAFDVGVYFEANGHGSVLFSARVLRVLSALSAREAAGELSAEEGQAVKDMHAFVEIVNPAVGDAWSNLLLVAAILKRTRMSAADWHGLYTPLASRLATLRVADRAAIETTCMDTRTTSPAGLQEAVDAAVAEVPRGRAFVRPSGTQDVVRVYAEAEGQEEADALALAVLRLVHAHAAGVEDVPAGF